MYTRLTLVVSCPATYNYVQHICFQKSIYCNSQMKQHAQNNTSGRIRLDWSQRRGYGPVLCLSNSCDERSTILSQRRVVCCSGLVSYDLSEKSVVLPELEFVPLESYACDI